jgi:hypothetical protein
VSVASAIDNLGVAAPLGGRALPRR